MRCNMVRRRVDPVLTPDQFSVARPLQPEDLDRWVTRYGIYPLLPAPNGVPWSEYVRTHRNKSRSVLSSTEALEIRSCKVCYEEDSATCKINGYRYSLYLPIHLFHTFNPLREVICLRAHRMVSMWLLMWIHQNTQLT